MRGGFIGVYINQRTKKWEAAIVVRVGSLKQKRYLGLFSDPVEAARAYDREAKKQGGRKLNFPEEQNEDSEMDRGETRQAGRRAQRSQRTGRRTARTSAAV